MYKDQCIAVRSHLRGRSIRLSLKKALPPRSSSITQFPNAAAKAFTVIDEIQGLRMCPRRVPCLLEETKNLDIQVLFDFRIAYAIAHEFDFHR